LHSPKLIKLASEGFTICTHTTSLSQDLPSIRENSQKTKKYLSQGKKGRHLQESNRGGSLSPDG